MNFIKNLFRSIVAQEGDGCDVSATTTLSSISVVNEVKLWKQLLLFQGKTSLFLKKFLGSVYLWRPLSLAPINFLIRFSTGQFFTRSFVRLWYCIPACKKTLGLKNMYWRVVIHFQCVRNIISWHKIIVFQKFVGATYSRLKFVSTMAPMLTHPDFYQ